MQLAWALDGSQGDPLPTTVDPQSNLLERPSATSVKTYRSRSLSTDMAAVRHDANGDSHLLRRTGLAQMSRRTGRNHSTSTTEILLPFALTSRSSRRPGR